MQLKEIGIDVELITKKNDIKSNNQLLMHKTTCLLYVKKKLFY